MKHNHNTLSGRMVITVILSGIISALMITFLLSLGLTSILLNRSNGGMPVDVIVFVIRFISVLIGCLICTGIYKEKILLVNGIVIAAYLIVLLVVGTIIYDTSFQKLGLGALSAICGGATSCFIRTRKLHMRRSRKKYVK